MYRHPPWLPLCSFTSPTINTCILFNTSYYNHLLYPVSLAVNQVYLIIWPSLEHRNYIFCCKKVGGCTIRIINTSIYMEREGRAIWTLLCGNCGCKCHSPVDPGTLIKVRNILLFRLLSIFFFKKKKKRKHDLYLYLEYNII